MNILKSLTQLSLDTTENWNTINPLIPTGCICLENTGTELKLKVGNGIETWNTLPYYSTISTPVLATENIAGIVQKCIEEEAIFSVNNEKYISPDNFLKQLKFHTNGDKLILSPGSTIFKSYNPETYITNYDWPTLLPYGSAQPEGFGYPPSVSFRMEHFGEVTVSFQVRKGSGDFEIRICKNLETVVTHISNNSSYRTFSRNVSIVPGDIITVQTHIWDSGGLGARIRNIRILINTIP